MNEFIENGQFRCLEYSEGFGYLLSSDDLFSNTDYRILQSQAGGLLPCIKTRYNGNIELLFLADNARPFADLVRQMTADDLVTVSVHLLQRVLEIRGNGFLNLNCLDLSWDHVYVESGTWKVYLAYVPVYLLHQKSALELAEELKAQLADLLQQTKAASEGSVVRFTDELRDPAMSLDDICRKRPQSGSQGSAGGYPHGNQTMKLSAKNVPEPFEILLDKDEMILGRSSASADAAFPFSRTIGRRHCRISRENGNYYVRDLGSLNGTFVNHVRLSPHESCMLRRGDILSLADSDFEVL